MQKVSKLFKNSVYYVLFVLSFLLIVSSFTAVASYFFSVDPETIIEARKVDLLGLPTIGENQ